MNGSTQNKNEVKNRDLYLNRFLEEISCSIQPQTYNSRVLSKLGVARRGWEGLEKKREGKGEW